MFVSEDLQVNAQGHLTIGGQDTVELAKQYGTPLYVMDEDLIRKHCRSFKQSMDKFYQGKGLVCYASKAFSCKAIYRVMQEEGMGVDVVSGGERRCRPDLTAAKFVFTATTRPPKNCRWHWIIRSAESL